MKISYVAAFVIFASSTLFSQEFRATISGAVTDPAGAAAPGVKVTITETRTGARTQTVSDSAGQYVVPFLAPGQYEVEAKATGFREFVRRDLTVGSGDHPIIDIRLQVGDTSTAVNVTAGVPLVDTANASMGQAITTKQVEDLPLNGRTPMMLAQLAIGVIATSNPTLVHPFDNAGAAAWSIGGSPAQTSELLVDGSPDATWDQRLAYSPPQDAVQEVTVKAFDTDAAYGHTNAGTANQILKTGTNGFHGSAYEFTQASALDANNFFSNRSGVPIALTHFNQYGLTAGGPVILPKLYNGKNKLFWFFAWENLSDAQPTTDFTTVPTAAERQGNFSALNYQLYNPYTGVLGSNNVVTRQAFPGNVIPQNLLNPIALAYLQFYPQPNITPLGANGFDNYANSNTSNDAYNNELGRIDYNMSEKSRLFVDLRHNYRDQAKNNYFGNIATGTNVSRENWGGTADEVYTLNPTTVLDARANFTRMNEVHFEPSMGFDPSQLGFPSYIAGTSPFGVMPSIAFGSCGSQTSFQCLGDNTASKDPSQSWQLFGDIVKIKGSHTLKVGTDLRQYRLNNISYGNSAGGYTFGNGWVRAASNSSSTLSVGQDLASFLLGLPTAGQYDLNASGSFYSYYFSGFIQDDWRIKPNLTINLGLRFDHDDPYNEKYGRTVNGFDFSSPNPIASAAIAAYNKSPIAQIPAGSFNVPGGLTYASADNPGVYQNTSHLLSPRVGFSWSPTRFHSKTVLRGGFGIFVAPITIANLSANGTYSSSPIANQEGFSQTTSMTVPSNFLTPGATLSNPFPTGILQPVGSTLGLGTFDGQTISFLNPKAKDPYSIRWNFGVQHTFGSNLLVEVDYMGNHAVHLPVAVTQLNVLPRQYLSTLPVRDQTAINALTATVANPFSGLLSGTSLNSSTTNVAQLLSTYPEFPAGEGNGSTGVILQDNNAGSSYFESLNFRVEKRLSRGLSIIGTYMYSKLMEEDSYLNDTDLRPEKRVSPFDHPHHLAAAFSYELPIGKGRALDLRSRWVNAIAGGWLVNGIFTFQTGAPILWMNGSSNNIGDYVYYGGNINVNNREANLNTPAFTTSDFNTVAAQQFQYHIRTFSTTFGNLRQDGINNLDASLLKRFNLTESVYFQLRFEAFNVMNHATFAAPNTTATNGSFGLITSQSNLPRQIQMGARFVF